MRDIVTDRKMDLSLVPATRTADANGTGVSVEGFEGVVVGFAFGASGDVLSGTVFVEGVVQESNDNSTYTDVAAADLIGTEPMVDAAADASKVYRVGYLGSKKYVRGKLDFTGTHTNGIPCATFVERSAARVVPVTQSA
jgi:hypothetical protein